MLNGQSTRGHHPIDATPFEAFYHGSWHAVDHVSIKDGSINIQVDWQGSAIEEKIHGDNLRLRSRKACSFDCLHFLRPGTDVCVLLAHPSAESQDQELKPLYLWTDAKIVSIKRVPHEHRCACLFSVMYHRSKPQSNMMRSTLDRTAEVVRIDNICILQKLKFEPCDDGFYQWSSSVDCTTLSKSKLLSGMFSSEFSWMIVLSMLRGINFEIKLMQNKIINHIVNSNKGRCSTADVQSDGDSSILSRNMVKDLTILSFQLCNEVLQPKIDSLIPTVPKEMTMDDRIIELDPVDRRSDSESEVEIIYDHMNLRHSKRRKILPDRFVPTFKQGSCQETISNGSFKQNVNSSSKHHYLSYQPEQRNRSLQNKLLSASECKNMLESCIGNIKTEMEKQVQNVVQWPQNGLAKLLGEIEDLNWTTSADTQVENQEHEDLWKEMEHSLITLSLLEQKQDSSPDFVDGSINDSNKDEEQPCQHVCKLDEQVGMICQRCKFICTEIRYISPPFFKSDGLLSFRERRGQDDLAWIGLESDPFSNAISSRDESPLERYENAWTLIPELKLKLHLHQRKAFEFLWKNLVGSLIRDEMKFQSENTGGCVISHSPGSGKTLLVISFLVSYLKVYPRSRPLILAPKIAIYTWCTEFEKWEVPIPVYQVHAVESYKKEMWDSKVGVPTMDNRKPSRKMMHVMDCIMKLKQWHEQPGVLLMSYSSFFSLTQNDTKLEYQRFMARVLRENPGILILDEGHNPRSTRSKLRKLLMKVNTELRILLSGTLFQNNFEEYFNTLCLARPRFINDTVRELDLQMVNILNGRKHKQTKKTSRIERLARKLFVEKIGQKIESSDEEERKQGFDLLNRITKGFVDNYENEISDFLPGLEVYTLLLTSTDIQREILMKLQRPKNYKRCPLELELLITVGSIHPWLIKTVACVNNFFNVDELGNVDKCKGNFKSGSKAKFVIDLVHKSTIRGERVLVFCHNIAPINMFVELFEIVFGWHIGEEVLVLQGEQELSVRVKIMDKFNGNAKGKCRVLLASTTACAEGISLTAASRVVLLDSEWNHSKTRQAIARAFRPGQEKVVYVYRLLASGTWEEDKYGRNLRKAWLSKMIFTGQYVEHPSSRQVENIDDEILRDMAEEDQRPFQMIMKND